MTKRELVDAHIKRVKTAAIALASISFVALHGLPEYWRKTRDFQKTQRYMVNYTLLTARVKDEWRIPGVTSRAESTSDELFLDYLVKRAPTLPSGPLPKEETVMFLLPGADFVGFYPGDVSRDTENAWVRGGVGVTEASGYGMPKVDIKEFVKDGQDWFVKHTDGGPLPATYYGINIVRIARDWGLHDTTTVPDAYQSIQEEFRRQRIDIPFLGGTVRMRLAVLFVGLLATVLSVMLSHSLREISGGRHEATSEPWVVFGHIYPRQFSRSTRALRFHQVVLAVEQYASRAMYFIAIAMPPVISITCLVVSWRVLETTWLALVTFGLGAVTAVTFASCVESYVTIIRSAAAAPHGSIEETK